MQSFESMRLPIERISCAPDGSDVRVLLGLAEGVMGHFAPAQTSNAITHRSVEEIWYFLTGQGEMWREQNGKSEIAEVSAGVFLTIPFGYSIPVPVHWRCSAFSRRRNHAAVAG